LPCPGGGAGRCACRQVSPCRASHFHLSCQMKVTKAKALRKPYGSFSLAADNTDASAAHPRSLGLLFSRSTRLARFASHRHAPATARRHPGDAQRVGWRRTANNPNESGAQAEASVLSVARLNEPYGVVLRPFALVTFIWASNESDSPGRAKPARTAQRPAPARAGLYFLYSQFFLVHTAYNASAWSCSSKPRACAMFFCRFSISAS
jgi:hypothetical protein